MYISNLNNKESDSGECIGSTPRLTINNEARGNVSSNGDIHTENEVLCLNLTTKGLNFGHLNMQGICGQNMSKFSQIKAMLSAPVNQSLHLFGISETKIKQHKRSTFFKIDGFQSPFRKNNENNGGGGIMGFC